MKPKKTVKANPLQILATLAGQVLPTLLNPDTPKEWKDNAVAGMLPDVLQAFGDLRAENERLCRVDFIGHHAVALCQTAVETCEEDSQLRDYARRAVKLAAAIYEEAEELA